VAFYLQGKPIHQGRLGLLPAAFNPPTLAHLGLAEAVQRKCALDQVVFVLPEVFPHKEFDLVGFPQRLELLRAAIVGRPSWAAGSASGGLFIEIAREFRALCGPRVETFLLCGRDAAIRIVGWDYGAGPPIVEQLREFQMIVAARRGDYQPPPELAARVRCVDFDQELQAISSSQVREAIAAGRPWRHQVPPAVARLIEDRKLYR
jgi:nicotinate-nucleotide adenylyltransferase